ncbi:unnamed protein product [Allacma fusca]|uniref:Lipocalin n=1 Tax=Allacma fusca TaxID=39272 RepID=A0A8J2K7F0_9HEXA|nr:unnamed protein product [Allacma fusca]
MKILALLFFVIFNKLSATVLLNGDQGFRARNDAKFRVMTISLIWLKELEDTYKSGFPKNFGATKFRNLSTVPNHNVPSGDASTCQNVTFFSVEQNRRLINKYGWDFVFNATTREMLDNPRARLFRYKYHDEMEDYHFLRSERQGMCTTLRKLRRRVESVFTFEKCIRLFERPTCKDFR